MAVSPLVATRTVGDGGPALDQLDVPGLLTLLRFRTDASDPACQSELVACARWLAARLGAAGMASRLLPGGRGGPPSVYAEWLGAAGQPTLLLYAHYDVQPAGPGWRSLPFAPVVVGGRVRARGATDDKGPLFAQLTAIERRLRATGRLPINVRVWFEGEEEVGSPALIEVLDRHPGLFGCDAALVTDSAGSPAGPRIILGFRGRAVLDAELIRTGGALHSGVHGGRVGDPGLALTRAIGRLSARDRGRAAGSERAAGRAAGRAPASAPSAFGGLSPELSSSISVLALHAGPPTSVAAAMIPDRAVARIERRLAPGDDGVSWLDVARATVHAEARAAGLRARLRHGPVVPGVALPTTGWAIDAARRAIQAVWGIAAAPARSGGTIAFVGHAAGRLGVPVLALGLTDPADGPHAPNESIALDAIERIAATVDRLLVELRR